MKAAKNGKNIEIIIENMIHWLVVKNLKITSQPSTIWIDEFAKAQQFREEILKDASGA
jgi:ribonuclease HIII